MKRGLGAAGSVLLHLALILALLSSTARVKAPPGHLQESDYAEIEAKHLAAKAPPMMTVPVKLLPVEAPPAAGITPPCLGGSYHGIGLKGLGGLISEVGQGTPADLAGLQVGDYIENAEILGPNRHPDGTELTLIVSRDQVVRRVTLRTAEICEDA